MRKCLFSFLLLLLFVRASAQNDTILVLSKFNNLGGKIIENGSQVKLWELNDKYTETGIIQHTGDTYIVVNDKKIPIHNIYRLRLNFSNKQKKTFNYLATGGTILSVFSAFANPRALIILVPVTACLLVIRTIDYSFPPYKLETMHNVSENSMIVINRKKDTLKYLFLKHSDTLYRKYFYVNCAKLFDNTLALSYEFKRTNNSKFSNEIEAGYIFEGWKENPMSEVISEMAGAPYKYFNGIEASYTFRKYFYKARRENIFKKYIGLNVLCKIISFQNKWWWNKSFVNDDNDANILMSQVKSSLGISLRNGMTMIKRKHIFDLYMGFGFRLASNHTTYQKFYIKYFGPGNMQEGAPPAIDKPSMDNGNYFYPYISFGFKYGFMW